MSYRLNETIRSDYGPDDHGPSDVKITGNGISNSIVLTQDGLGGPGYNNCVVMTLDMLAKIVAICKSKGIDLC